MKKQMKSCTGAIESCKGEIRGELSRHMIITEEYSIFDDADDADNIDFREDLTEYMRNQDIHWLQAEGERTQDMLDLLNFE